jgi:hypothetical protein
VLGVSRCTFPEVRRIRSLFGARDQGNSRDSHWIGANFQRKCKFSLGRERLSIGIIRKVEIWQDAPNPLCFLKLELFGRDLNWIVSDLDGCVLRSDP